MTDYRILAIQGTVRPDDLGAEFARARFAFRIEGYRRIYYPYDWVVFRYRASTWMGATGTSVSCLVDARTRVCATADPFRTESLAAGDAWVLDRRVDCDTTLGLARRYADHAIRQRRKALVLPRVEVVRGQSVYKPFWVCDGRLDNTANRTMLFDGVTGDYCALPSGVDAPEGYGREVAPERFDPTSRPAPISVAAIPVAASEAPPGPSTSSRQPEARPAPRRRR